MRGYERRGGVLCATVATVVLVGSACSVDLTSQRTPGFLETQQDGATIDTVDAFIDGAIIAQVLDQDGRPMNARFIRFTALPAGPEGVPGVLLAPLGFEPSQPTAQVQANPSGISIARVRLGSFPGEVAVIVTVFELEEADTVYYQVLPGGPHSLRLEPRDTTVQVGASFDVRSFVGDFYDNEVVSTSTVILTAEGSVSLQGSTLTADAVGTGVVRGVFEELTDSITVEVTAAQGGS